MDNEKKALEFDLRPEIARGTYSNFAIISHSRSEFIIDFASILPGLPKAEVVSRIVSTPENCKRLLAALQENIRKYESIFGPIPSDQPMQAKDEPKGTLNIADFNLNGTKS